MKNRFFDIDPPERGAGELAEQSKSAPFRSKYLLAHYAKLRNLNTDLKRLPEKEEFFFLQTETSFNAFTFIQAVAEKQSVRHLSAVTYSINKRVVEGLMELHDAGKIERITLCVSDSLIKRNPTTVDVLAGYAKSRANVKILFAWVHAKVAMMETKSAHYVVEGSGNWSENAHYEQYVFANSRGLLEFRKELIENANIRYTVDHNGLNTV